jgi:HSP20 family protein
LSEDEKKKKYYYYYGGKEKKAGEVKKSTQEIAPYSVQQDFDKMMKQFQRTFDEFWESPPSKWGGNIRRHLPMPAAPSVDLEDRGKDYRLVVDLPGFNKEDVDLEVTEDSIIVQAKKTQTEEEKQKNFVRKERSSQAFYRSIPFPEMVRSEDAKANMNNGTLEVILPKKEPKKTKKVAVT